MRWAVAVAPSSTGEVPPLVALTVRGAAGRPRASTWRDSEDKQREEGAGNPTSGCSPARKGTRSHSVALACCLAARAMMSPSRENPGAAASPPADGRAVTSRELPGRKAAVTKHVSGGRAGGADDAEARGALWGGGLFCIVVVTITVLPSRPLGVGGWVLVVGVWVGSPVPWPGTWEQSCWVAW